MIVNSVTQEKVVIDTGIFPRELLEKAAASIAKNKSLKEKAKRKERIA